jgi:OmpA-OmpF porin, OOP family
MRHRWLLGFGLAVAAALSAGRSSAQLLPPGSFYFGAEGGWTNLVSTTLAVAGHDLKEGFDAGDWDYLPHILLGVRAGYQFGPWSIEEEGAYRHNQMFNLNRVPFSSVNSPFQGQRNSWALMTNALYSFDLPAIHLFGVTLPVSLHPGLGIGAVRVIDTLSLNPDVRGPLGLGPGNCCLHGSSWEFAYQAIAGVRFELTPNLLLDIDYRYLGTPNGLHLTNEAGAGGLPYKIKGGYQTHHSFLSLIWRFPPPPPPPPPVAPAALPPR